MLHPEGLVRRIRRRVRVPAAIGPRRVAHEDGLAVALRLAHALVGTLQFRCCPPHVHSTIVTTLALLVAIVLGNVVARLARRAWPHKGAQHQLMH